MAGIIPWGEISEAQAASMGLIPTQYGYMDPNDVIGLGVPATAFGTGGIFQMQPSMTVQDLNRIAMDANTNQFNQDLVNEYTNYGMNLMGEPIPEDVAAGGYAGEGGISSMLPEDYQFTSYPVYDPQYPTQNEPIVGYADSPGFLDTLGGSLASTLALGFPIPGATISGIYDTGKDILSSVGDALSGFGSEVNYDNIGNLLNTADTGFNNVTNNMMTQDYSNMFPAETMQNTANNLATEYANNTPNMDFLNNLFSSGGNLYDVPDPIMYPELASMQGVLSGIEQPGYVGYDIAQYGVPDISSMMPTSNWFGSMSPEVMAGIMQPFQKGSETLMEQLNSIGGLGSQRGGASGTAAAGLGEYWANAMPQVGMTAWNMVSPAQQAGWQANLNKNIYDVGNINTQLQNEASYLQNLSDQQYGMRQQENLADYNAMLEKQRSDYNAMQEYRNNVLSANQYPFSILPGLLGGTYSNPVINDSGGTDWLGAIGAGIGSYYASK